MLVFESLPTTGLSRCLRAKVPGGWLVATFERSAITFVPDPQHVWDGSSLP